MKEKRKKIFKEKRGKNVEKYKNEQTKWNKTKKIIENNAKILKIWKEKKKKLNKVWMIEKWYEIENDKKGKEKKWRQS